MTAPLVIAHRGSSGERPENTLPAYELAVDQAADMIEIDLHTTSDGAIVVTHDEELAGLGGEGEIAEHTLAEVRALDAGGGERVPTLEEVLDGFSARIPFNLELKQGGAGPYPELPARTWAEVARRGLEARMLFSSFWDPVLHELRSVAPDARIGLLLSRRHPQGFLERAKGLAAEAIHPERVLVTPELVTRAHGEGLRVHVFTVDDPEDMARLLEMGVDGIFTNFPERMRRLVPRG